jgi:3-phosphoglycerate kinase
MTLQSIDGLKDLHGKTVLVRVDHNVEFDDDGKLKDDRKIRVTLPTLEALLKKGARLILMTHVGRPKGKRNPKLTTAPIAEHLKKLLKKKVKGMRSVDEVRGPKVKKMVTDLKDGEILYLENVRFCPEEEGNDKAFCKDLASLAEIYVNEAFPSLHLYEESSTCGVARLLPAYAGYYLQKEIDALSRTLDDPRRPLLLIISGAKMETKIPVIRRFLDIADDILLGGCIANTFIAARGFDVGSSKYEEAHIELAQELMLESEKEGRAKIHVPRDVVVASEASETATKLDLPVEDVAGDMSIFDIGKVTLERYLKEVDRAGTIIWNGPLGLYEYNRFSHGTKRLAEAIKKATKKGTYSLIGGGDTLDFHMRYAYSIDAYSFVSTGGGAMLEFLSGDLPALEPLLER